TEANLNDEETLGNINMFIGQIEAFVLEKKIQLPSDAELVLELYPKGDDHEHTMCGYYFVDNHSRTLFWPEEFEADYLLEEVKGVTEITQISECVHPLTSLCPSNLRRL